MIVISWLAKAVLVRSILEMLRQFLMKENVDWQCQNWRIILVLQECGWSMGQMLQKDVSSIMNFSIGTIISLALGCRISEPRRFANLTHWHLNITVVTSTNLISFYVLFRIFLGVLLTIVKA